MTARAPAASGPVGDSRCCVIELTANVLLTPYAKLRFEALCSWEGRAIRTQTALILMTERPDAVRTFTQIELLGCACNPDSLVENCVPLRSFLLTQGLGSRTELQVKDHVREIQNRSGQSHDRKRAQKLAGKGRGPGRSLLLFRR